ncbi:DUF2711 family protein [Ketogulonicigenium robustum]|uniref:DUF2711 family protein n=1 Tax=Ketogulonicigenium robustum TaxID=92947 RepID=UPI000A2720A3
MYVNTPYNGRILDIYSEHFSRVWVVLSPFLRPQTIPFERFVPGTYPTRNEILADCEPVRWEEVLRIGGFDTLSDLDIALRSYIHGLTQPNQRLADQLDNMIEGQNLIPPTEGDLAPHNERKFLLRLKSLGHSHVLVYSEFGDFVDRMAIDEMIVKDCIPPHGVISTDDGSFLVASHWDSCCSFLCAKGCDDEFNDLEKFLCTDITHVYWGLFPI